MLKLSTLGLLVLLCILTVGCSPFRGLIYTGVSEPGVTGGSQQGLFSTVYGIGTQPTLASYEINNSKGPGPKTGTGSVVNILGLFAFGDASVAGAASQGNIKTINTIDGTYHNFLFFFSSWTTKITGE